MQGLSSIQNSGDPGVLAQEQAVKEDLLALMDQEDMIWRQRAKINWLKEGDRNTKFFHACAKQRSTSNKNLQN